MRMSESEGLNKLTEYLKQTRRQADAAIDHLNEQVAILNGDNLEKTRQLEASYAQINVMKIQMEKMKEDQSMKSVFKERDDWKSLVDSIQRDRARLQEENHQLLARLDEAHERIDQLASQIQTLVRERDEQQTQSQDRPTVDVSATGEPEVKNDQQLRLADHTVMMSPVIDRRTGRTIAFSDSSPLSLAQRLKEELKRAHEEMEEERKRAELEMNTHIAEIVRLRGQLDSDPATSSRPRGRRRLVEEESGWFGSVFGFFSSSDQRPTRATSTALVPKKLPTARVLNV